MSQEQPQRPTEDQSDHNQQELNKYAEIFSRVQANVHQEHLEDNLSEAPQLSGEKNARHERGTQAAPSACKEQSPITIGHALQAVALTAGQKLVHQSDAAAIQAAEVRATGQTNIMPKGLAATAQSAAQVNAKGANKKRITLADVLSDAKSKLPKDRPVTRQDAEGVVGAELRNSPNISTYPGGVAASVVAAARINQKHAQPEN